MYYFLEDVYPRMSGRRPLRTPGLVKLLFPAEGGEGAVEGVVLPPVVPPPQVGVFVCSSTGGGGAERGRWRAWYGRRWCRRLRCVGGCIA